MLDLNKNLLGKELLDLAQRIFPLNRSLTGDGNRQTLKILKEYISDLKIYEVKSGTTAFDWTVPQEWKVDEAYIVTPNGEKICDYHLNNLNLVGYSIPFEGSLSLDDLDNHLFSNDEMPEAIPYVTSYYKKSWGFCISRTDREKLKDGIYHVVVRTKLFNGSMTYGEVLIDGESEKEIFMSTYICHPSMANNEVSGPTVLTYILKWLQERGVKPRYTIRAVFVPETIGSIYYLSKNLSELKEKVIAGLNFTCVGDDRAYSILYSKYANTTTDKLAAHVIKTVSPNVDLPFISLMRSKHTEYPEYHTSLDTIGDVVTADGLFGGFDINQKLITAIENHYYPITTITCEPMMSKRDLYPSITQGRRRPPSVRLMMNFLSWCDGTNSLVDIAEKLNIPVWDLYVIAENMFLKKLIKKAKYKPF
jgi:aminopeptidase-like protein